MIHIDGIIFSLQAHGGISVYFRELLKRLHAHQIDASLTVEAPLRSAGELKLDVAIEQRQARVFERLRACRRSERERAAVFHSSYYRKSEERNVPSVVTVHDFAYERRVGGLRGMAHSVQKFAAIRAATDVICISEATRDDLMDLVGVRSNQKVHVIYNGVSEEFHPVVREGAERTRDFILFVGQRGGYKNFRLALQAMESLPEFKLCCVGGGSFGQFELAGASEDVRTRVKHLGYVSDSELNLLYNDALCLVYPSSYEGFGIPLVEAMRAGCPVVATTCKAVLEVGGDALAIAQESSAESLVQRIRSLADVQRRREVTAVGLQRSQRFSWDQHFQQTLSVYRSLGAC